MTRSLFAPRSLLCAAVLVLSTNAAWAKPKVALTAIEGDASGDVREAVAEALDGKELSLIGPRDVNRAVDRLGDVADLTEKDFKKLASELEADAIILGKLGKKGTAKTLKFRLYVNKKLAKGFTVSFKDPRSEKFRMALHDKMVDKLGGVIAAAEDEKLAEKPAKGKKGAPVPVEEEEEPVATKAGKKAKKAKVAAVEEEEPVEEVKPKKGKALAAEDEAPTPKTKAKKTKTAVAGEEEEVKAKKLVAEEVEEPRSKKKASEELAEPGAEDEAKPEGEEAEAEGEEGERKAKKKVAAVDNEVEASATVTATPIAPKRTPNRFAVRLDVGGSVVKRQFTYNATQRPPNDVSLNPVPGARLDMEMYPLAFTGTSGVLANLGIGVEYDRTLSLNLSTANGDGMPPVKTPVKQSHYSVGLRYRQMLGQTETSPSITIGAGYGKRLFSPDRSKLTGQAAVDVARDTPQTNYVVIDPGLAFRYPVTRMIAIAVGGRALIVTDAGGIQSGTSYGRGSVFGFDADGGVELVFGKIGLRLAGEFTQLAFNFEGVGALSNGLGDSGKVGGMTDRAFGGSATLGVFY